VKNPRAFRPGSISIQFRTSPYCRKVRLALGYKGISFQVENLTPGLLVLKLKPLTGGLRTVPVLLPQLEGQSILDFRF